MFKQSVLFLSIFFLSLSATAQTGKCFRYKDIIFTNIRVDKDIPYRPGVSKEEKKAYLFDLYQPLNDEVKSRPLIIWMHGGGFKFGSKEAKVIRMWSQTFAQRGYVCASINYRLSKHNPLFHFDELLKSSYLAVQDAKTAVEYFKQHYKEYNIDPDKIVLAGNSAGGIMALQAAYASNEAFAKMAKLPDTVQGAKTREIFKVAAVVNCWGAIYDLKWLKNARVPIINILGSEDGLVPPTHKSAPLFGGIDIHAEADALKIPNRLKIFKGYSHELRKHFNPLFPASGGTRKRQLEAGEYAADFLYAELFK
jgi:poly(3-hydroxybutyrate) depolymerase